MCGPAAIGIAGLAIAAAGTAVSVQQQRAQAEFQQEQIESDIKAQETAAALREEDRQRKLRRVIAEQKVLFGASGTQIDAEILAETGAEFAREQFNDDFNLNRSILNQEASISNLESTADNAITSGVIDFGVSATSSLNASGAFNQSPADTSTTGATGITGIGLDRTERLPGRV